jgi:2-methylcitrate dehydratase PrpD
MSAGMAPGATRQIAAHALSLQWAALPVEAQVAAQAFLLDTLAVGVAGRHAPGADAVFAAAGQWSGGMAHGRCGVLGRPGARASAPYAAFVNALQIHSQEFDCVHEPAVAHPMATVLSAVLAQAQQGGPVSGADFLAAVVAGVDVVALLGTAATTPLKFFRPATCGIFGSVAALCRLRRLGEDEAVNAFGNALAYAAGTMQAHLEGKPTLALQVAGAARSAVEAVDLATAGLPAPNAAIEGPFGYMTLFEDAHDLPGALTRLGRPHAITQVSWKPFPTGRAGHGGIHAIQTLMREHGITADAVDRLEYHAPPLIVRLVGRAAFAGMGTAHARLCLPYLGAVTLTQGSVGLGDFTPQRLADPALLALAGRITVHDNGNPDPAAFGPARAVLVLRDGRRLDHLVMRQLGSPAWPLTRAEQAAKVRACLAFGGLADAQPALEEAVRTLADVQDAGMALGCVFGESVTGGPMPGPTAL